MAGKELHWLLGDRVCVISSSWKRWRRWKRRRSSRSKPFVLRELFNGLVFYLLYAVEAVVLVAGLCFFYIRFGFRL
ncbi:hypothetical protein AXF42_Ash006779 [Apostasia shenzhenica]|uniref:Transmembrane protein n=1 Tax=Apostasia shenzhenica TaxID=1088818 RepID=A0A2I0AJ51_9ASPA|nr:hypothetical protein AXF42_Ash006779 [Apostasia shenzhenica]